MKAISKALLGIGVVVGVAVLGGVTVVFTGIYNVAADDPHTRPVTTLLEITRERSIAARAGTLEVPGDLDDPTRIRQGAGNYDAMCTVCHLSPGMAATELSQGLYPAPPDLTRETVAAAEAFWAIKHGIKASGMPAWGKSMDDAYIWNMAAFLQVLPELDEAGYAALVASSEGHSHGGGETGAHSHAGPGERHGATADTDHPHDAGTGGGNATSASAGDRTHTHADGSQHTHHPASQTPRETSVQPPVPEAGQADGDHQDDGHEHEH